MFTHTHPRFYPQTHGQIGLNIPMSQVHNSGEAPAAAMHTIDGGGNRQHRPSHSLLAPYTLPGVKNPVYGMLQVCVWRCVCVRAYICVRVCLHIIDGEGNRHHRPSHSLLAPYTLPGVKNPVYGMLQVCVWGCVFLCGD